MTIADGGRDGTRLFVHAAAGRKVAVGGSWAIAGSVVPAAPYLTIAIQSAFATDFLVRAAACRTVAHRGQAGAGLFVKAGADATVAIVGGANAGFRVDASGGASIALSSPGGGLLKPAVADMPIDRGCRSGGKPGSQQGRGADCRNGLAICKQKHGHSPESGSRYDPPLAPGTDLRGFLIKITPDAEVVVVIHQSGNGIKVDDVNHAIPKTLVLMVSL